MRPMIIRISVQQQERFIYGEKRNRNYTAITYRYMICKKIEF